MNVSIRAHGFNEARALLGRVAASAARMSGPIISLSNREAYAYGIETGRTHSGRLARRAGGAFMYRRGIDRVRPEVPRTLGEAVLRGPAGIEAAKRALNQRAITYVQAGTPVVSGKLRAGVVESRRPA